MKHALARCVLIIFVLLQATFPMRAYAVFFIPPIVYAGVTSVAVHASALLLTLGALSMMPSGSSSSSGGAAAGASAGFGPNAAGAGGIPLRLDGNTTAPVPGWPNKAGADGKPVPVPPPEKAPKPSAPINGTNISLLARDFTTLATVFHQPGQDASAIVSGLCQQFGLTRWNDYNCYDGFNYYKVVHTSATKDVPPYCESGYKMSTSGPNCLLDKPADVKKPDGVPCEPVFKGGKFQYDPSNPACAGKTSQQEADGCQSEISAGVYKLNCVDSSVNVYPSAISYQSPQGSGTVPISIEDGAVTITVPTDKPMQFPGGFMPVTVDTLGTYSCDSYGLCVPTGVSGGSSGDGSTTGGSTGGTSSGGSTGGSTSGTGGTSSGSGTTSGGTETGSSTGTASGTATTTTSLDDSAFKGLGDKAGKAGADASGSDDTAIQSLKDGLSENLNFLDGISSSWVPVPRDFGQCKPIPFKILGASFSWDICPYAPLIATAMGYLFYIFTALYLFRIFTDSSKE